MKQKIVIIILLIGIFLPLFPQGNGGNQNNNQPNNNQNQQNKVINNKQNEQINNKQENLDIPLKEQQRYRNYEINQQLNLYIADFFTIIKRQDPDTIQNNYGKLKKMLSDYKDAGRNYLATFDNNEKKLITEQLKNLDNSYIALDRYLAACEKLITVKNYRQLYEQVKLVNKETAKIDRQLRAIQWILNQ